MTITKAAIEAADLTRPIIGIENRTAQEVFDIMCDRIKLAPPAPAGRGDGPITKEDLADALDCFWNAAIGEAHTRQAGMDVASILAEGINAVSIRLKERAAMLAAAPEPPANSQGSLDGSEPMMTDEEFKQLVAEVGQPEDTLPYLRVPSPAADPVKAQLVEALKASDTALADWLHIYADDMCDESDVEASKARIDKAGSTLAYLSDLFEMNRAAIDAAEKEASSQSPLGWPAPAPVDKIVAALSDAEDAKE